MCGSGCRRQFATGFRPDLALFGELRLDLDDRVEAARALAPLIDPHLRSPRPSPGRFLE
jgi:hypothetical protein